jgi:hypothetical protein
MLKDYPLGAGKPAPLPASADEQARLSVLESFEPDALEDDPELAQIVRFAAPSAR